MSKTRKKYISPKYEIVKFDSQIMTDWSPGCWGVVGVLYEDGEFTANTCHVAEGNYGNILPIDPEYH